MASFWRLSLDVFHAHRRHPPHIRLHLPSPTHNHRRACRNHRSRSQRRKCLDLKIHRDH